MGSEACRGPAWALPVRWPAGYASGLCVPLARNPYRPPMAGTERRRELRRRRKRSATLSEMKAKLEKATPSDKAEMARKLRLMTPGCEELIQRWSLEER